jgi:hypothetical protein
MLYYPFPLLVLSPRAPSLPCKWKIDGKLPGFLKFYIGLVTFSAFLKQEIWFLVEGFKLIKYGKILVCIMQ